MSKVKIENTSPEKSLQEKTQELKNLISLIRVIRRMAIKIYMYNQEDEIFFDGTFTKESVEKLKQGAMHIAREAVTKLGKEGQDVST